MDTDENSFDTKPNIDIKMDLPFNLNRKFFLLNYKLHYALKSIIIHPFRMETFASSDFLKWVEKAREFTIRQTWNGNSVGMMSFSTYSEADNAICDLRLALGDDVDIRHCRHSAASPDAEVDSILDHQIRDSLAARILVLEGIPSGVTQEQISEHFPDSRTVILVQHDPRTVQGLALVEYPTQEKAQQILDQQRFAEDDRSYIVVEGQRVVMSKYKSRQHQVERSARKNKEDKRKAFEKRDLNDEERMSKCADLKHMGDMRDACLDDMMIEPHQRIVRYVELTEEMTMLSAVLNYDAGRRERQHLQIPEPNEMKTWQQLYKDDQAHGADAYIKPVSATNGEPVRSLLDLNPFEVLGAKRKQAPASEPMSLIPPKKLMESSYTSEISSTSGLSGCMQNLKSLSAQITSQINIMEDMITPPKPVSKKPLLESTPPIPAYRLTASGLTANYRGDSSYR